MVNQCGECGSYNIKVTDSREHNGEIWRTRVCSDCGNRIYTVEVKPHTTKVACFLNADNAPLAIDGCP